MKSIIIFLDLDKLLDNNISTKDCVMEIKKLIQIFEDMHNRSETDLIELILYSPGDINYKYINILLDYLLKIPYISACDLSLMSTANELLANNITTLYNMTMAFSGEITEDNRVYRQEFLKCEAFNTYFNNLRNTECRYVMIVHIEYNRGIIGFMSPTISEYGNTNIENICINNILNLSEKLTSFISNTNFETYKLTFEWHRNYNKNGEIPF